MATNRGYAKGTAPMANTGPSSGPEQTGALVAHDRNDPTSRYGEDKASGSLPLPIQGPALHPSVTHGGAGPPFQIVTAEGVGKGQYGYAIAAKGRGKGIGGASGAACTIASAGRLCGDSGAANTGPFPMRSISNKRTRQDRKDHPSGVSSESEKPRRPPPPMGLLQSPVRALQFPSPGTVPESTEAPTDQGEQMVAPLGAPTTYGATLQADATPASVPSQPPAPLPSGRIDSVGPPLMAPIPDEYEEECGDCEAAQNMREQAEHFSMLSEELEEVYHRIMEESKNEGAQPSSDAEPRVVRHLRQRRGYRDRYLRQRRGYRGLLTDP